MNAYFLPLLATFVSESMHGDGSYSDEFWQQPNILLTEEQWAPYWRQNPPAGKTLGSVDGMPAWVDLPGPTDAEITSINTSKLQAATQLAAAQKIALTNRVGTLQDAVDLEMATPEEVAELPVRQAQLLDWKRYAIFLGRVTLQIGWALTVEWPLQPTGGMDLSVSAAAPESS